MPHTEIIHHYKRKDFQTAFAFLVLFFIVQVIGLSIQESYEFVSQMIPFSLLIILGILQGFHKEWDLNYLLSAAGIFLIVFLVFSFSTQTSKLFGPIFFERSLGWKIWDTPAIIGVFWFLPIYCIFGTLEFFRISDLEKSFLGAVLLTSFDIFMEPVAYKAEMWRWTEFEAPPQNYLAWLALAFIIFRTLHYFKVNIHNPLAMPVFILLFASVLILNFIL